MALTSWTSCYPLGEVACPSPSGGASEATWEARAGGPLGGAAGYGHTREDALNELGVALAEARLPEAVRRLGWSIVEYVHEPAHPYLLATSYENVVAFVIARDRDHCRTQVVAAEISRRVPHATVVVLSPETRQARIDCSPRVAAAEGEGNASVAPPN